MIENIETDDYKSDIFNFGYYNTAIGTKVLYGANRILNSCENNITIKILRLNKIRNIRL